MTLAVEQISHAYRRVQALTEISVQAVEYDLELSDNVFTLSNLRNPRN